MPVTKGAANHSRSGLVLPLVLVFFPILLTSILLLREMRGIPMFDDYQALIYYSLHFVQLHGLSPRLLFAISAQHDEYKLIFEHLLVGLA